MSDWLRLLAIAIVTAPPVALAEAPRDDDNLPGYELAPSLDQVFAAKASSPRATEPTPHGQWFRVEKAHFTGGLREVGPGLQEFVVAWRDARTAAGPSAGLPIAAHFYPDVQAEIEQNGSKHWLLLNLAEVQTLRQKAKMELTLFVQRMGFVEGEPQVYLRALGDTEQVRIALEAMSRHKLRPQPEILPAAPRPPPPPLSWRLARYTQGEARVWHDGKETLFPIRPGSESTPLGLFRGLSDTSRIVSLQYCVDPENCITIDLTRIDASLRVEPPVTVNLRIAGRNMGTSRSCRMSLSQADDSETRGTFTCSPRPGEAPLERMEFFARP